MSVFAGGVQPHVSEGMFAVSSWPGSQRQWRQSPQSCDDDEAGGLVTSVYGYGLVLRPTLLESAGPLPSSISRRASPWHCQTRLYLKLSMWKELLSQARMRRPIPPTKIRSDRCMTGSPSRSDACASPDLPGPAAWRHEPHGPEVLRLCREFSAAGTGALDST